MQTSQEVGWRQVVIVSSEPANTHANGYLYGNMLEFTFPGLPLIDNAIEIVIIRC